MTSLPGSSSPVSSAEPAPAATVPAPSSSAFNNRVLIVAASFAAIVVVAAVVLGIGEKAETKMSFFKWAVTAGGAVLATALAAMGYSVGQLFKNVVPAGFVPAAQAIAQVSPLAMVREITPARFTTLGAAVPDRPGSPRLDPNAPDDPSSAFGSSGVPMALLALLPLAGLLCGGCVGTSAQFKKAAPGGVNNVVLDMRDYTGAADWDVNHNGVIDPDEAAAKASETALTDNLAASVADEAATTVEGVETAWRPVESVWRRYVATDPILDTPEDRKIRYDTGDGLNRLIKVEKERQAALKSSFGLSGLFGSTPAPPTPTTQPAR